MDGHTGEAGTQDRRPEGRPDRIARRAGSAVRIAGDVLHVRRVFGDPVVRDDVTLVPVARVVGGSGSGWGSGELGAGTQTAHTTGEGSGSGGGGGFGVRVTPVGVYVVRGAEVEWRPAFDLARAVLRGQAVLAVVALAIAWAARRRRR